MVIIQTILNQQNNMLGKKQINEQCDQIIRLDEQNQALDAELNFLAQIEAWSKTKNEIYVNHIHNLRVWFSWLRHAVDHEEFETAAKIKKCIKIETNHFLKLIMTCKWCKLEDINNAEYITMKLMEEGLSGETNTNYFLYDQNAK